MPRLPTSCSGQVLPACLWFGFAGCVWVNGGTPDLPSPEFSPFLSSVLPWWDSGLEDFIQKLPFPPEPIPTGPAGDQFCLQHMVPAHSLAFLQARPHTERS